MASLLLVGWLIAAPGSRAINIQLSFNSSASEFPDFDPDGSLLIALFQYAETFYEDVFEDSHTIRINFWYEDISDAIGRHSLVSQNYNPFGDFRENEGNIRIDSRTGSGAFRNWFLDPTPWENSEFNMSQTLWRDLDAATRDDWYNNIGANVPQTFEVGYTGSAIAGGPAAGRTDLLSVVLHEVGHALGMSSSNFATQEETSTVSINPFRGDNDGDYDFQSRFVFGSSLAAETANNSDDDNANIAHLENTFSLMTPAIGNNVRRLASHTDLFSMAAGHRYNTLDVPRREFYGGTNWNTAANWSGDKRPSSNDDVYIRDAQGPSVTITSSLSANGVAANLFVSEGARVATNGFKLDIANDVTVADANTFILVAPSGELEANLVTLSGGGTIRMSGGLLDLTRLRIGSGSRLEVDSAGTATVSIDQELRNDGVIRTRSTGGSPSHLVFNATQADNPWNLDGLNEGGQILAEHGDVVFNSGGMSDSFSGTLTVGPGYRFHFNNSWTNNTGEWHLNGGNSAASVARVTGGSINFTGGVIDADDGGTSLAHIDAPINISGGTVTVGAADDLVFNAATSFTGGVYQLADSGEIKVNGPATFAQSTTFNMVGATTSTGRVELNGTSSWAGTHTFNQGVVQQNSVASTTANTTINAGVFDLDGSIGTLTTWNVAHRLTLNAQQLDTSGNVVDSALNITAPSGSLVVNLPAGDSWTLSGKATLTGSLPGGSSTPPLAIRGSRIIVTDTINVANQVAIDAPVSFAGESITHLPTASDTLHLLGTATVDRGATFSGAGTLQVGPAGSLAIQHDTTLGVHLHNAGQLTLGPSPAQVTVSNFNQTATGHLHIEIGGPEPGTHYDQLNVAGTATLGGTIEVSLADLGQGTFDPAGGQLFTLVVAAQGVTGTFEEILLPELSPFKFWDVRYGSRALALGVIEFLPGDVNRDGMVTTGSGDVATDDVAAFIAGWRTVRPEDDMFTAWEKGDMNFDGVSNLADAMILRSALQVAGLHSPFFDRFSVPEPRAVILLALGLVAVCATRRRR